jgi:hypothetical protein
MQVRVGSKHTRQRVCSAPAIQQGIAATRYRRARRLPRYTAIRMGVHQNDFRSTSSTHRLDAMTRVTLGDDTRAPSPKAALGDAALRSCIRA